MAPFSQNSASLPSAGLLRPRAAWAVEAVTLIQPGQRRRGAARPSAASPRSDTITARTPATRCAAPPLPPLRHSRRGRRETPPTATLLRQRTSTTESTAAHSRLTCDGASGHSGRLAQVSALDVDVLERDHPHLFDEPCRPVRTRRRQPAAARSTSPVGIPRHHLPLFAVETSLGFDVAELADDVLVFAIPRGSISVSYFSDPLHSSFSDVLLPAGSPASPLSAPGTLGATRITLSGWELFHLPSPVCAVPVPRVRLAVGDLCGVRPPRHPAE